LSLLKNKIKYYLYLASFSWCFCTSSYQCIPYFTKLVPDPCSGKTSHSRRFFASDLSVSTVVYLLAAWKPTQVQYSWA
jgi:hypothetical protein